MRVTEEEEEENFLNGQQHTKYSLQERVDHQREQFRPDRVIEKEWEDEKRCEEMKQSWLRDFAYVFKEDLSQEDRIEVEPVKATLINGHEDVEVFHPKVANEVPAYLQRRQRRKLN